jgi:hypothetical protein
MICFGLWPKRSLSRKQLTNNITLAIPYIAKERTVLKSFTTLAFSYKKKMIWKDVPAFTLKQGYGCISS